jgi:hypothetical protein
MEEIILISLVLGITLCVSFTVIIVFGIYSRSDKFLKVKLENMNNDVNSLALENRRLRGAVNRSKREVEIPDNIDGSNIEDVALSIIPKKYHKITKSLIPKVEEYIVNNPEKLEQVLNQIKGVNHDGNKQQQIDSQASASL